MNAQLKTICGSFVSIDEFKRDIDKQELDGDYIRGRINGNGEYPSYIAFRPELMSNLKVDGYRTNIVAKFFDEIKQEFVMYIFKATENINKNFKYEYVSVRKNIGNHDFGIKIQDILDEYSIGKQIKNYNVSVKIENEKLKKIDAVKLSFKLGKNMHKKLI